MSSVELSCAKICKPDVGICLERHRIDLLRTLGDTGMMSMHEREELARQAIGTLSLDCRILHTSTAIVDAGLDKPQDDYPS